MAAAVGTNKYGLDAELFTRSDKGAEARGASMVQRHAQQMQKEKEDAAMANLAVLMPEFSEFTRIMALQEAEWNVEGATTLMNQFAAEKGDELKALHKKQKKLHRQLSSGQDDTDTVKDKDAAGDGSSGSGASSSSSDDDSEDRGHKKSRRKSSKSSKKKRSKDKDRKKTKKEKGDKGDRDTGDKDKALGGINPVNFGKYGIIRETDMAAKSSEFTLWAVEVKGIDVTTVGRIEERELFRDYIEDYNTGTFPHRKYYNLEAYERERAARAARKAEEAARKGKSKPASQVAKDDEEALRREKEAERQRLKNERLMDAYKEMKRTDKAANMKEQEELRLKMNLAYKTGDVDKARKLAERMAPDKEELKRLAEGKMPKRRFKDLQ